ncbi:MAG: hybrid sensor histidine kinase/response regulator [Aquidulcibacter sp.]|jgi:two-component system chemotaxis sensor kinase CheA|uniref:hybrid sensor histidine kinase/response regulator n=1 Tax=Aquidulcibacter sp. TaxID=2052990 RepID=UPI0022C83FE5|nr:hybrid sensor histidine kinase/response regulator [Aquidulcibacter sp.]MCE2890535.1 hybrid sensor histidine kinase/response regulator [Hyphomonadaceae bacterium]MCZ8207970.1 hybrid sensor histidine kinase/response regulator [Aquidulcibacter sp.]
MDELLGEFITETNEFLETVDTQLVVFEADPTDGNTLNSIFRLVHTIKGTCGFLGLPRLQFVAHAGETLLGKFRDGTLVATPDQVQLVLESIDRIKEILAELEATGAEPEGDDSALIGALELAAEGHPAPSAAPAEVEAAAPEPTPEPEIVAAPVVEAAPASSTGLRWDPDLGRELRPGEVSLAELEAAFMSATPDDEVEPVASVLLAPVAAAPVAVELSAPAVERRAAPEMRAIKEDDEDAAAKGGAVSSNQTIRVNVEVLETLMTMVSELVLTRNQLMQMVRNTTDSEFKGPLQRLSAVTAELQDSVMKTRMQPIGSAWKKLPRIVRDAARDLNKKIDLIMDGEATELDRQVLELIKDPLTHMIRNSCDHGLEAPATRVAAGKSEMGSIRLNAYHEGGHIVIEVSDDGAGLSTARIRDKAIKNGLVSEELAWTMSDSQIHRFIFAPGFSTAAAVTSISGRGVGMDVVRTNIELIGGTIDLQSTEGRGTKFFIKIPLTLAIVSALVVGSRQQRFAIPQLSIVELVGAGGASEHKVEVLNSARVLRLRDRLLPLVDLSEVLGVPPLDPIAYETSSAFVVVMQHSGQLFGVVVDEVFDTEEIVVKPLSKALGDVGTFSGATILGDGSVIMIIDPGAVYRRVGQAEEVVEEAVEAVQKKRGQRPETTSMIVFQAGGEQPKAVPLSLVTRLEELDATSFEQGDGRTLVQYRGELMPIVAADPYAPIATTGVQPVLVFTYNGLAAGMAVDKIVDIVDEALDIEMAADRAGLLGVAVLKGKATEVLDVSHYLSLALTNWDDPGVNKPAKHIVLVERNPFFRNLLSPLLRSAGYEVEAVDTVSAALVCAEYRKPSAVLTDIDVDVASARRLLSDDRLAGTSIVALSGSPDADATGFASLVRKSDRDSLIAAVENAAKLEIAA